jgi:hypothetical protein
VCFSLVLSFAQAKERTFLPGKAFDKIKQTTSIPLLLFLRPTSKGFYNIH